MKNPQRGLGAFTFNKFNLGNPHSGIGKPEPLKYDLGGLWSRRIVREHRPVYGVFKNELLFYSYKYHYDR